MIVCPAPIGDLSEEYLELWGPHAAQKYKAFQEHYLNVSRDLNTSFMNAESCVTPLEGEGIHWDAENHKQFGLTIAQYMMMSGI